MSDHDTWNMFLAHAFAARIVAGSEYPVSDAAGDADVLLELSKKWKPEPPATDGQTHTSRTVIDDGVAYPVPTIVDGPRGPEFVTPPQPDDDGARPVGFIVDGPNGPEIVAEAGVTKGSQS